MQSVEDLIPSLIAKTQGKKLEWKESHFSNQFETQLDEVRFTVSVWNDEKDDSQGFSLAMYVQGKLVDAVQASEYSSNYAELRELFSVARRSYHNVDSIVNAIKNKLSSL